LPEKLAGSAKPVPIYRLVNGVPDMPADHPCFYVGVFHRKMVAFDSCGPTPRTAQFFKPEEGSWSHAWWAHALTPFTFIVDVALLPIYLIVSLGIMAAGGP